MRFIYSVITKSNYELCSKLGSTMICNIQNTKFRESTNFIVPIGISENRVILISNVTDDNKTKIDLVCKNSKHTFAATKISFLKIPSDCEIKTKYFDISTKQKSLITNDDMNIETIQNFEIRSIANSSNSKTAWIVENMTRYADKEEFEKNNNMTTKALNQITINHEGIFDDIRTMKVSGISVTVVLSTSVLLVLMYMLKKRCKRNKKNEMKNVNVNVNLNPENAKHEKDDTITNDKQTTDDEIIVESIQTVDSDLINKQFSRKK